VSAIDHGGSGTDRNVDDDRNVEAHLVVHRGDAFTLDVEFTLAAGRTTALVGPNGAGKSTVLAALAGLLRLDGGLLRMGATVLDDPTHDVFVPAGDRRIGMVFQDGLLLDHLDVRANVAFGPRSRGANRAAARQQATDWLTAVGIESLADRRPTELSGGEAQRVALCRALATQPRLMLLDEPFSALDIQSRATLRRTLATHLATVRAPRLLVTHDPVEAFLLADQVMVIEAGRITQSGTPDELRQHPATRYAAELAGTNLLSGEAAGGDVRVGSILLYIADRSISGPVLLTIAPQAITVSLLRPAGSPRNAWPTLIDRIEQLGDRTRITVSAPVAVTAELTPASVTELQLTPGTPIWLSVKATEVAVRAG
jgi:molybdate transport system ATP-binding protein